MKKIMLILISVVMLFTACEKSSPTQIDPLEEFGDVMFGMSKEEVINTLGTNPDDENELYITYNDKTFFKVNNAEIDYVFDDYSNLYMISVYYFYSIDVEQEQILNDYASIKETLLENYPFKKHGYYEDEDDRTIYSTENRSIDLYHNNHAIFLSISDTTLILPDYDDTAGT